MTYVRDLYRSVYAYLREEISVFGHDDYEVWGYAQRELFKRYDPADHWIIKAAFTSLFCQTDFTGWTNWHLYCKFLERENAMSW